MRRRGPSRGTLWWTLAASAFIHLVVAGPIRSELEAFLNAPSAAAQKPVRVVQLSPERWSQNARTKPGQHPPAVSSHAKSEGPSEAVATPTPPSPSPSPSASPSPSPDRMSGQIVDVAPTADDTPDPNARFLAVQNTRVEKETSARIREIDPQLPRVTPKLEREGSADEPVGTRVATPEVTVKGDGRTADKAKSDRNEPLVLKMPEILRREGLDLSLSPGSGPGVRPRKTRESLRGKGDTLDIQLGRNAPKSEEDEGGRAGAKDGTGATPVPSLEALMPTIGTLDRISGSPREAHIEGVEEGDATFLNAKEYKYATFFVRVRDAIRDPWASAMQREYQRRDPTGQIYGMRDRSTVVAVVLKPSGDIADITVQETSGVDFLDDVAVDAFRKAQPFPNPPAGLIDPDGMIRLQMVLMVVADTPSLFRFRALPPP